MLARFSEPYRTAARAGGPRPVADRLLEDLQETEDHERPESGEKDGDQRESGRTKEFELQPQPSLALYSASRFQDGHGSPLPS